MFTSQKNILLSSISYHKP